MTDRLIRLKTVMEITSKSRSAIYAEIAGGSFPNSIQIGARAVAWQESAIASWIKSKVEAGKKITKAQSKLDLLDKNSLVEASARWEETDEEI
jgi:prophage regulatory protein